MYDDNFKIRYTTAPIAFSENLSGEHTLPHIHCEIEMLCAEVGGGQVNINGNTFRADAGDLFFVNPLEVHEIVADADYRHKCICFDTALIADPSVCDAISDGQFLLPACLRHNSVHAAVLSDLFLRFYSSAVHGGQTLFLESAAFVSTLFAYLMKHHLLIHRAAAKGDKNFYREMENYLKENCGRSLSSKSVANAFGYTQSYFCRMFKQNFGICFSEYLTLYRISLSKKLLEDASRKINDVAFETGFSSPVHFSRCFKKYVGMLPSAYRKCQYRS